MDPVKKDGDYEKKREEPRGVIIRGGEKTLK